MDYTSLKECVEKNLDDRAEHRMGRELNAVLALSARKSIRESKPSRFLKEYIHRTFKMRFNTDKEYLTFAYIIFNYLYPKNPSYWRIQDKRYDRIVRGSTWLMLAEKIERREVL